MPFNGRRGMCCVGPGIGQAKTAFVQTCVRHTLAMKVNLERDGADEGNLMLDGWLHDTWLIRR